MLGCFFFLKIDTYYKIDQLKNSTGILSKTSEEIPSATHNQ
jgi:hypothetical protein